MKKLIRNILSGLAAMIVLIMIFNLSACSKESHAETKSLYAQGLEVVKLMSEMAQTEEYAGIYTGISEIRTVIQNIGSGDFSSPKAVYAISIADDDLAAMAELGNLDNASEELKNYIMQRTFPVLITQINAMSGTTNLAVSSVCSVGKTFVNENATENVIYLYVYENAVPVAVIFTVGENHAVSASGMFIMYDGFTCGSADEIKSSFRYITVDVSEVLPEK
ncbi:hypothetical protein D3Z51_18265 [Clostridiaceae bacterium]|nr:hypothetical protein [Clostridiaceae bacterium]RKI09126.1 hypothetical protein D7V81_17845 [bacterium 1XD21-70]